MEVVSSESLEHFCRREVRVRQRFGANIAGRLIQKQSARNLIVSSKKKKKKKKARSPGTLQLDYDKAQKI